MSYVPPSGTISPAWQAGGYARPTVRIVATWGDYQYVSPVGLSCLVSQPLIVQQLLISPVWGQVDFVGSPQATKEGYYATRQWRVDGSWLGESAYAPTAVNVTFSPVPTILPVGFNASRYGAALVAKQQFVSSAGAIDGYVSGSHFALHWYEYARPLWRVDASWLGMESYAPPNALLDGKFAVAGDSTQLGLVGFDSAQFGSSGVRLGERFVSPSGIHRNDFGQPTTFNKTRRILVGGKPSSVAFGEETKVFNRTRYLTGVSLGLTQKIGSALVLGGIRSVLVSGITAPAIGYAWASHSPRFLSPASIGWNFHSAHTIGYNQEVAPQGFDAARFGTRIIPESRTLYAEGFDSYEFGSSWVSNFTRRLWQEGFNFHASEEMRFGSSHVWNSRQYVELVSDPNGDLAGTDFGIWQKIENVNRVVAHHSTAPPFLPSPSVYNKARPLLPVGVHAPDPAPFQKVGDVSHKHRSVSPVQIDPPYIQRWTNVSNNARIIRGTGYATQQFGIGFVWNNRRSLHKAGDFDASAFGDAFIAPAVRQITFDSRYGIAPPIIRLPDVRLNTRYLERVGGLDAPGVGGHALTIHWNIAYPRWTHREHLRYGVPIVANKTPMLRQRGANHEEFGVTQVRTQWRRIETRETFTQVFGRHKVSDRRQWILPNGDNQLRIGDKLKVQRTGAEPPATQWVTPEPIRIIDWHTANNQFGKDTFLNFRSIFPESKEPMTKFGAVSILEMGINLKGAPSIVLYDAVPNPAVSLKRRFVTVSPYTERDDESEKWFGILRMSPWTIYSTFEPNDKARYNNNDLRGFKLKLHYIDHNPEDNTPLYGVGLPSITLLNRRVYADSQRNAPFPHRNPFTEYGTPDISLRVRWLSQLPMPVARVGFPRILGVTRMITVISSGDEVKVLGVPTVSNGRRYLQVSGQAFQSLGRPKVEFFHRAIRPGGWASEVFGSSRDDYPWQWQTLNVGPRVTTTPNGADTSLFGEQFVSLRVRGVSAEGFDAFISDYEVINFARRMRVTKALPDTTSRVVWQSPGFDSQGFGYAAISNKRRYIAPDGNMDNFRKGAPNA